MIGMTEYTTDEIVEALGCSRSSTTRKITRFQRRLMLVSESLIRARPKLRSCDVAAIILAMIETGGRLADLDRGRLRMLIERR